MGGRLSARARLQECSYPGIPSGRLGAGRGKRRHCGREPATAGGCGPGSFARHARGRHRGRGGALYLAGGFPGGAGRVAGGQDRLCRRRPDGADADGRWLRAADAHSRRRTGRGGTKGGTGLHHALGRIGRAPHAAHGHHPLCERRGGGPGLCAERARRRPAEPSDRLWGAGADTPVLDRPHLSDHLAQCDRRPAGADPARGDHRSGLPHG